MEAGCFFFFFFAADAGDIFFAAEAWAHSLTVSSAESAEAACVCLITEARRVFVNAAEVQRVFFPTKKIRQSNKKKHGFFGKCCEKLARIVEAKRLDSFFFFGLL